MTINAGEIRIGSNGSVHIAPAGTALPAEPGVALNVAFIDVGAVTEDGVAISTSREIKKIKAWQSRRPVRTTLTGEEMELTFALQQWNADNLPIVFGGGAVTVTTGGDWKFTPPAAGNLPEKALVVEWLDSGYTYRFVAERVIATELDEIKLVKNAEAMLGMTVEVLGDDSDAGFYILTDDPAFTV